MLDFDVILTQLPSLKNLLDTHGSMSLFEYGKAHYCVGNNTSVRKQEFLEFLRGYVEEKFGSTYAETVVTALSKNYAVSTAEHHGPMGHPFFFQSALLRGLVQPELPIINFATSHVSLGNSSYPRGLVFHGDGEKAPKEYLHLPFFSSKLRMCPVFALPAYTGKDIEGHCILHLKQYRRDESISEQMYERILEFIQKHVLNPSILNLSTYSEQITRMNHTWWNDLFPAMPEYISLDAEDITVELLKKHLQENTSFSQMMTNMTLQEAIEEEFDGISCCFDRKAKKGTYLFWYLDKESKRHALWREGNELVSIDNKFRMQMTQETYRYHLERGYLVPSGLLVYSLFVCYYGLTCFGGFAQGEYLTKIQKAFASTMDAVLSVSTPILNEDMVFLSQKNGEIMTALDMQVGSEQFVFLEASQTVSLETSFYKMKYEISRCF